MITLLPDTDMELIADMDNTDTAAGIHNRFNKEFLHRLSTAAQNHLYEKGQIRDTLALLKIYHQSNNTDTKREHSPAGKRESTRKRQKANQDTVN